MTPTDSPGMLTAGEIDELRADLKRSHAMPMPPTTVADLITAVEQLFDCEQGEVFAYTRHPPQASPPHNDVPDDQRHWYATFVSASIEALWHDFVRAYELTGGARRVAKPKLYWRLAPKIQELSSKLRTRIAIPDLSFSPFRETWLAANTYKPEGMPQAAEVQS